MGRWHAACGNHLRSRFDDELRFFKGWIDKPKAVGLDHPHEFRHGAPHGLGHRSVLRPAGLGSRPRDWRDHPRYTRSRHQAGKPLRGRIFRGFRSSPSPPFSGGKCDPGRRLRSRHDARRQKRPVFDSVVSGVPLLNFPGARIASVISTACSTAFQPAGRSFN